MGKFMIIYDEQEHRYHFPFFKHAERTNKIYQEATLQERIVMDEQYQSVLKYYFLSYGMLLLIGIFMFINYFKMLLPGSFIFSFLVIVFSAICMELAHHKMMHTGIYYKERYRWVIKLLCLFIFIFIFTVLI